MAAAAKDEHNPQGSLAALTIGAMGVVYGDIGTSPLYAVNEIFFGHAAIERTDDHVIGCISLICWTLTLVVLLKYLLFVLRADNDGEGGTFALYGLLHRHKRQGLGFLLWLLMLAAGLLFGEGIYVPFINWALYVGCITLVVRFESSSNLAAAYGLSVSGVMLSTSIAMTAIARLYWKWSWPTILLLFVPLAIVDASFLAANSLKFLEGGYIPLSLGVILFVVMTTWRWGRKATYAAYSGKRTMTMKELVELKGHSAIFDRNAILMVPKPLKSEHDNAPALLQLLWERWGILPKNLIFVEAVHRKVPYVHDARYHVTVFDRSPDRGCIISVTMAFGFMEDPNVEKILESLASHQEIDLPSDPHKWVVHASQENILLASGAGLLARLRLRLFALLRQISTPSYYYYGLGDAVQLSTEIMPVRLK